MLLTPMYGEKKNPDLLESAEVTMIPIQTSNLNKAFTNHICVDDKN